MNFFVDAERREASHSTCYFEFIKGRYKGKCWLPNSISIRDYLWDEYNLSELIRQVVKEFDYCGITIVTKEQWNEIVKISRKNGGVWKAVIEEAVPWANDCFKKHNEFSIFGI